VVSGFAPLLNDRLKGFDPAAVFFPKPYKTRDITCGARLRLS
jgi:hypothetical protein